MKTKLLIGLMMLWGMVCGGQDWVRELDVAVYGYYKENGIRPLGGITEEQYVRRAYLQIAGRVPTLAEVVEYQKDRRGGKRALLVDKLVGGNDYVSHWYNFWAEQLRLRDRINEINYMKGDVYGQWVEQSIRKNKRYDRFVWELLTAEGKYIENGAVGYFYRDFGMPLDNLIGTVKIFAGTDISCAQCHDDPFHEWTQYQFYESAAYFVQIEMSKRDSAIQEYINKIKKEIYDAAEDPNNPSISEEVKKKSRGLSGQIQQFLNASQMAVKIKSDNKLKLPSTYKYEDAKPNDVVGARVLVGKWENANKSNLRLDFADWFLNKDFFAQNFVNRAWGYTFGAPLISPVENFTVKKDQPEYKVLVTLGKIFERMNYDVNLFMSSLYKTQMFQRQAWTGKDLSLYRFEGPVYRRLRAEQLWDSILVLVLDDVNYFDLSYYVEAYKKLMTIDFEKLTKDQAIELRESYQKLGGQKYREAKKYKQYNLVRAACVGEVGGATADLLKMFGRSDRELIGSSNVEGSVTQVISFMNGPFSAIVTNKESRMMRELARIENKNERTDYVFRSILQRLPTVVERSLFEKYDTEILIWALLNSQEFKFN